VQRFAATTAASWANLATEQSMGGAGVGDVTVAAGSLAPGKTISVDAFGFASATGTPTFRVRLKFGSTVLLDMTTPALAAMASAGWRFKGEVTCVTTGAGGTVFSHGILTLNGTSYHLTNTAVVTYDTTVTNSLSLTGQWSVANAGNIWSTQILRMIEEGV